MAGRINFLGHPVHPMLVVFPLGLLPAAVACDIVYLVHGGAHWAHMAYWLIAAGGVGGLVAAGFGFFRLPWPAGRRPGERVGPLGHGGVDGGCVIFSNLCG